MLGNGARVASDTLRDVSKDCSTDADEQCGADGIADVASSVAQISSAAQMQISSVTLQSTTLPAITNLFRVCVLVSSHGMSKASGPAIVHTLAEARGDVGPNDTYRKVVTIFDRIVFNVCMDRTRKIL